MSDARYIQFPLCLLQETYDNPDIGLNKIISFGICHFATKQDYALQDVARQCMYGFYRGGSLPPNLHNFINDYVTIDEDYHGFDATGKEFFPELEIDELIQPGGLFEENPDVREEAIKFYQLHQAADLLNVKLGSNNWGRYDEGLRDLVTFESIFGKDCWPSCRTGILFDFRDNGGDLNLLRAYIGIKSLTGRKPYVSTCKSVILQRMMGCKSKEALKAALKKKEIKDFHKKFTKSEKAMRYQMDKLLEILQEKNFIKKISMARRIFITTNAGQTIDEFARSIAEDQKAKDLKRQERDAREFLAKAFFKKD